jgi:hypothetical protein
VYRDHGLRRSNPKARLLAMNQTISLPVSPSDYSAPRVLEATKARSFFSWGAVIAGVVSALALEFLFMLLGSGLGFAIYSPLTDAHPVGDLAAGAVVVEGISAVFSLWFGGWIAGRFAPATFGVRSIGWLHGFAVWATATVVGVLIVTAGAGWALGDLSKLVGGGLSLAGKPAAALAGTSADGAKSAVKQSADTVSSFVDEAVAGRSAGSTGNNPVRAKREIGFAAERFFTADSASSNTANRSALIKTLIDDAGMSDAEAEKTVADWSASYDRLKADLAAAKEDAALKAREAADKSAEALAAFSLCAFVALVFGGLSASCGGHQGSIFAKKWPHREYPAA